MELFASINGRIGPLDLGTVDIWGPSFESLGITVAGKGSRSTGYAVELDSIVLTPVGE